MDLTARPIVTVGSLFSGYGGLDSGVALALDAEPIWFSEFDKAPSAILAHHYPAVPNLGDITKIDWATVARPDIITGGSPCQDMSHAGKRMGMKAGTRSGLWSNMLDAITALRPQLVVWENVRGALSAEADSQLEPCAGCVGGDDDGPVLRALGRVLGDLAGIGYDAAWTGLRAADVGAPHGRFRVFVLAWPAADADRLGHEWTGSARDGRAGSADSDRTPAGSLTLLPTPVVNDMGDGKTLEWWDEWAPRQKSSDGRPAPHGTTLAIEALRFSTQKEQSWNPSVSPAETTSPSIISVPTASGRPRQTLPSDSRMNSAETQRTTRTWHNESFDGGLLDIGVGFESLRMLPTPRATDGTKGGPNQRGSSGDLMLPSAVVQLLPTPTAVTRDRTPEQIEDRRVNRPANTGGLNLDEIRVIDFGQYAAAIARWESITRPAPSPTEPTGKDGAQRLSARFVEWMQGLPDGWVTDPAIGISRNDQLKALGNGVVPQQCAAAVRHLLGVRNDSLRVAA